MTGTKLYPFRRGDGPLVSVLLPTRGRPKQLVKSVDCLLRLASDPSQVEIILKIDDDDQETIETCGWLLQQLGGAATVLTSSRGRGYSDLHLFYNLMADVARGDWFWLMNDDCQVHTADWDVIVASMSSPDSYGAVRDEIVVLLPAFPEGRLNLGFPMVRRRFFEVLGHLSVDPIVDVYLLALGSVIGRTQHIPILITHDHDRQDTTAAEREEAITAIKKQGEDTGLLRQRLADAQKLLDHIDSCHGVGKEAA